ncbi:unnamed protein product [Ectocarpus sp. 12 AP-2014]
MVVPRPTLLLEDDVLGLNDDVHVESARTARTCSSPAQGRLSSTNAGYLVGDSPYRQRCNSIVSHRTNLKVSAARKVDPRRTAVHALNAVEAAFAAAGGDAIPTANMPLGPAGIIMSRNGHRDHDGGELHPRSRSIVATASPPRSSYPSREERLTPVDRRLRSPHRCAPDIEGSRGLAVDKMTLSRSFLSRTFPEGTTSRAERERSDSNDHHREEEGMAASMGALRRASVGLQRDVDEVMGMVCRLHSRLSDAACWTKNLQEDTRASRRKVTDLITQVQHLSEGTLLPITGTHEKWLPIISGSDTHDAGSHIGQPAATRLSRRNNAERDDDGVDPTGDVGVRGQETNGSTNSETSEGRMSRDVSPLASRPGSPASSRSSSASLSSQPGSKSRSSRPGSPFSQESCCGSMAPMYSPAFPAAATTAAATVDGAAVEVEADTGAGGDNQRGKAAEIYEGKDCPGDRRGDGTNSTRQRRKTKAMGSKVSETNIRRGSEQRPLACRNDGKLVATLATHGGERCGDVSEQRGAAAQQLPKVSNESKMRGKRRSRSRGRRVESTADASDDGGGRGGGGRGNGTKGGRETAQALSTPSSPRHDDGGGTSSHSSPRSDRDNQRERGVPPSLRQGSPPRGRRHRRSRRAKRRDRGDGSTNNDRRVERQAGVEVTVASKAGEKKEAVGDGGGGGAGDGRCDKDESLAEEGVLAEDGVGPDPTEAGHMLQALAGLSTTLRRLSRAEDNTVVPDNPDPVRTAEETGGEGGRGDIPPACERCVVLSESLKSLRERARAQERLLEHSDKLLTVATTTAAPFDTPVRSAGQRDESRPTADAGSNGPIALDPGASADPATPVGVAADVAPIGQVQPAIRPAGNKDVPRDEQQPEAGSGYHASASRAGDEHGGAHGADEENEKLLAAAEEVWRVSEMARNALQGELERKDEALSAATKTARESTEALSKQRQEVARLNDSLRNQEMETEKWKADAERFIAKEKDTRRVMEGAKVAAADVLRRSDRERKALMGEVDTLNEKISALRSRLGGVQTRRHAECELAAKKTEEMQSKIAFLETALDKKQAQQHQQHQAHQELQQPPLRETLYFAERPNGNEGNASNKDSSSSSSGNRARRRYSSAGPSPLTSVREAGRRRTFGSPAEAEAAAASAAAAAAAAVWDCYGGPDSLDDAQTSIPAGEEDDYDESFESLPEGEPEERCSPWSPGRRVSTWESGGRRGAAGPVIAARYSASGGAPRTSATTPPRLSPSGRLLPSSFHSPQLGKFSREPSFSDSGDREDKRHHLLPTTFPPSAAGRNRTSGGSSRRGSSRWSFSGPSAREGYEGGVARNGPSSRSGARRRVSAEVVVAAGGGGDSRLSFPPGSQRRRVRAPGNAERFTQAPSQVDIDRVLRRASQSLQPRDNDSDTRRIEVVPPLSTDSVVSNDTVGDVKNGENIKPEGRDFERSTMDVRRRGDNNEDENNAVEINVLPPPHPRQSFEEPGGGGWRGLLRAALRIKEQHANVNGGSSAGGDSEGRQGQHPGTDANGTGGGNGQIGRQMGGGDDLESDGSGGGGENKMDPANLDSPLKVAKECPPNLKSSEHNAGNGTPASLENEDEALYVQLQRSPPQDIWDSAEGAGLSTAQLEGVVNAMTEEEAERLLREEGMVDSNGNLRRENTS